MGQISIGKPIDTSLIRCCSCGKGYDFKNNIYENNILVCPHCGLKHKIDFKLFDNRIGDLKKVDRLNLYGAIDIGSPAINRNDDTVSARTHVQKTNAANASGKITSVEIWANSNLTGCEVATFFVVSGDNLSTRDTYYIGEVAYGAKRTFSVDLDVQAGDYLGIYAIGGVERSTDTEESYWYATGDRIPCTNYEFLLSAEREISLYGKGETVPNQVANVQATDGTHTDKVRVTWNAASGADRYYVWNGSSWINVGLVTAWDHTGAPAPTITPGSAAASDGEFVEHIALSLSGQSANNGSSISYKVKAYNTARYGAKSASNSGYKGVGTLTYQWQRSAGDSDADYSDIDGATTPSYNDTEAPADGSGRYYRCVINATGAGQQISTSDRGYRSAPAEFEYIGTGSFIYSGTAITIIGFSYSGSGELIYSGTAEQVYSKNYLYSGSGELAFSGSAVIIVGLAFVGSGSLAYSGEAVVTYTRNYISTAVGELVYSGEAIFSYLCNFLFSGSGELAYSGAAICEYTIVSADFEHVGSGQFIFNGTASQIYTNNFSYSGSGDFVYSGVSSYILGFAFTGSGSLLYSGEAIQTYTFNYLCVGSGELVYSGSAIQIHTRYYLYEGSGDFTYSGTAITTIGFAYIGSGDFVSSGEATQSYTFNFNTVGSGNFVTSGSGSYYYEITDWEYIGSGVFAYSGKAAYICEYFYTKVIKELSTYTKLDKETATYTKVHKPESDYTKKDG